MTHQDAVAECGQRPDLRFGKFAIAEFMPRIDQLDANGARIDVARPRPIGLARMPGAPRFRYMTVNGAVLVDGVMRRNLGVGIAQPRQRLFRPKKLDAQWDSECAGLLAWLLTKSPK